MQVPLTPSGALGIINRVSEKVKPVYKGIEVSLSAQSVLHGDETGWRMDGQRWYMWVFCNRDIVYFHPDQSRASKVPKDIVGENYAGVMHADFYGAYNIYEICERQTRRRNEQLEKKNKELTEENNTLREDIKRAYNQIQEILGIKSTKDCKGKEKNNEDKEKKPSVKRRGAPIGHTGRTRPVPTTVDKIDIIPPPEKCSCCNASNILPSDEYISKYIEDIVPIVKMTTEKRYLIGTCTHCQEQVISPEATSGPPVIVGHNLIALLSIMREQMGVSYRKLRILELITCGNED